LAIEQIPDYFIHFLAWPTFFILALALFRMRLKQYVIPIIVSTCIMAPTAALLQSSELIYLITIIQPLVFLFCLMAVFHFKFIHSIIMIGLVFIYDAFVEYGYNIVIAQFNYEQFMLITQNEYIMQGFWVTFINCLTVYILTKSRWGFTFISPRSSKARSQTLNIQKKLYVSAMIFIFPFSMIGLCIFLWKEMFLVVLSVASLLIAIVLHYCYKRELLD
jgi:hypothetical protein